MKAKRTLYSILLTRKEQIMMERLARKSGQTKAGWFRSVLHKADADRKEGDK